MTRRLLKWMRGRRRLQHAIDMQLRRINPFWAIYLPAANMAEVTQLMRNVKRLEQLATAKSA